MQNKPSDPPPSPPLDLPVLDPPMPVAGPRSSDSLPAPNRRDREVARSDLLEAQVMRMMRTLAAGQVYWIPNFGLHVTRSGPSELTVIEGVMRETVTSRLVILNEVCRRLGVVFRIMDHAVFPPEAPEDMVWANAWKPMPPLDVQHPRYEPRSTDDSMRSSPSLAPLFLEAEAKLTPRAQDASSMEVV
ncbi:MAG: hypothetical protein DWC11_01005 [Candidatus Poseidoniales archaeon]|nr:MAG: hypothetical protein DWC11_01005 [Candidatus Poseidoniales archaeon]